MRNEDYIAVAVGYNFGIVPSKELEGIQLKPSGAIKFENENWNLYKAATFDESRKIDVLLDRFGEYPIKDYQVEDFNQSFDTVKENSVWITIYKDILGIEDNIDNITSICVQKDWLIKKLSKEGETLDEWLNEYTADDTDPIARDALAENIVLDYEKEDLVAFQKIESAKATEIDSNLAKKIVAAQNRSGNIGGDLSEHEQVWKVTFFRVTPEPEKHEFDVYVDMIPKALHDGRKEFLLNHDKQQEAFEKAKEVVGEEMLSEYVIMNAQLVDKARHNTPDRNIKEPELDI